MTDTSFHASTRLVSAIDADYRARIRTIEATHEEEMLPIREEFTRKRNEADMKRKNALARAKTWRDSLVKRAGAEAVES